MDVDRSRSLEKGPIHAQKIEKACPPAFPLPSFKTDLLSFPFVPGIVLSVGDIVLGSISGFSTICWLRIRMSTFTKSTLSISCWKP